MVSKHRPFLRAPAATDVDEAAPGLSDPGAPLEDRPSRGSLLRLASLVDLPVWIALAWSAWALLAGNLFFMRPATCLNKWDEGYITAFAARLLDGQMLPYVDAVSQRGPVFYWLASVPVRIWGRGSWMPMRVASLVAIGLTLAFTFLAARRAGQMLAAGAASLATALGLLLLMGSADGLAFNGEHVLNVFSTAALLATTAALDPARKRPSRPLAIAAGALAALAALSKQFGLVSAVAPLGLWFLVAAVSRSGLRRRERAGLLLAYMGGAALPVAAVVTLYARAGELKTLWYWLYTYNARVYMAPFPWRTRAGELLRFAATQPGSTVAALIVLGIGLWFCLLERLRGARSARDLAQAYDAEGFSATVTIGTVASLLAALSPMRFFLHYFVQVVPWGGLLGGLLLERAAARAQAARRSPLTPSLARAALLGLPLIALVVARQVRAGEIREHWSTREEWRDGHAPIVCADVWARSKAGDAIFVWGFQPDLYIRCQRNAASRYVFTTMQSGFVPWMPEAREIEEARVVPGSREALIADLEASRAPIIIDAPRSLAGRGMTEMPVLSGYLAERYCAWKTVTDLKLFVRREPGESCAEVLARR
jgi:hypothetical protein